MFPPLSQYFKTIKKRHTGESQCIEKSRKYWIALRLRLAAWKTALRVYFSPELQQQTFEIGSDR
jgi:hypothetical protein